MFDDAQHVAFAGADDAAVADRIVEDGGEHGRAVAAFLVKGEQLVERVGVEQRHVGCGDQHGAVQIVLLRELRHRALHGAAGSGDVVLVDDGDVLVVGACGFGDAFGLVVDHHGERIGVKGRHGVHDTVQERFAGQGVQHLRFVGTHAGAFARGKDDCGAQCHLSPSVLLVFAGNVHSRRISGGRFGFQRVIGMPANPCARSSGTQSLRYSCAAFAPVVKTWAIFDRMIIGERSLGTALRILASLAPSMSHDSITSHNAIW